MVRQYAAVAGIAVLLLGVLGLILGDGHLGGLLNIDITEDLVHLLTGGLLAYVGLAQRDVSLARTVVGVVSVVYLLVGIIGFIDPRLFGLVPSGYLISDNIVHLALGIIGIVVAWLLPRDNRAAI